MTADVNMRLNAASSIVHAMQEYIGKLLYHGDDSSAMLETVERDLKSLLELQRRVETDRKAGAH